MSEPAPRPFVVGIVGGGQLARMMHQAAIGLGVRTRLLAEGPDVSAAQVVADVTVGEHTDPTAVRDFAAGCDVITFDHEHVPTVLLRALEADGVQVRPGPDALVHAQDKAVMRERLSALGIPCPAFQVVPDEAALTAFGDRHGWPVIAKTSRGGYDGKGVWKIDSAEGAAVPFEALRQAQGVGGGAQGVGGGAQGVGGGAQGVGDGSQPQRAEPVEGRGGLQSQRPEPVEGPAGIRIVAEEFVDFTRELSVLVVRSPSEQAVAYPVSESVQRDGICVETTTPAPGLSEEQATEAQHLGLRIAHELGVVGLLAVELMQRGDGSVVVNELAMRPHNTGHWSIDGAHTSQFENHLRAVLDLPLGDPTARQPWTMMANVLGGAEPDLPSALLHSFARDRRLRVHLYGKEVKPGRKVGHVTTYGDDLDDVRRRAHHAAGYLMGDPDA